MPFSLSPSRTGHHCQPVWNLFLMQKCIWFWERAKLWFWYVSDNVIFMTYIRRIKDKTIHGVVFQSQRAVFSYFERVPFYIYSSVSGFIDRKILTAKVVIVTVECKQNFLAKWTVTTISHSIFTLHFSCRRRRWRCDRDRDNSGFLLLPLFFVRRWWCGR